MSGQEIPPLLSTPLLMRETLDSLLIPVPQTLEQDIASLPRDDQWRRADEFVTRDVAESLWISWNPEERDRIKEPAFLSAFQNMLKDGAALGFKLDRFRDTSRSLPLTVQDKKRWIHCFEDAISRTDAAGIRICLSPERYQSFRRDNPDKKEASWDETLKLMSDGLFYELGLTFPPIAVVADDSLDDSEFRCEWNDIRLPSQPSLPDGKIMVNDTAQRLRLMGIKGEPFTNPGNGNESALVEAADKEACEQAGLTTWDPKGYTILAVSAAIRKAAPSLVNRSLVELYLFRLSEFNQDLIDLVDQTIDRDYLVQILRALVAEQISIRDLPTILGQLLQSRQTLNIRGLSQYIIFAVSPFISSKEDTTYEGLSPLDLAECVRTGLKRTISHKYTRGKNTLMVYLVHRKTEARLEQPAELDDVERSELINAVREEIGAKPSQPQVLLTTLEVRHRLWKELRREFGQLVVLSYQELSPEMNIQPVARIEPELEPYNEGLFEFLALVNLDSEHPAEREVRSVEPHPDARSLITLLGKRRDDIVRHVTDQIPRLPRLPALETTLETLVGKVFSSYCLLIATGDLASLDNLVNSLLPPLQRSTTLADFSGMPLLIAEEVRRLLADEYLGIYGTGGWQRFNDDLTRIETAAGRAAQRMAERMFNSRFGGLIG